jgi:hypothetical protein
MSNGGEKAIPLIIKVIPASITTPEDIRLASLKDFLAYAKKYPAQARRMFTSPDFMMWLTDMGYEYMDIFEHLVHDSNKERALENFFILSKLKNRALLSTERKTFYVDIGPEQKDLISGEITIRKTGWGFVEADVVSDDGEDWFAVSPERLTTGMFSHSEPEPGDDTAVVKYTINTAKLKNKINKATVKITGGISVTVVAKKKGYITVSANKSCYDAEDSGTLNITNNCGEDIMLDITTRDGFVKFDGKRYYMGATAQIPFSVKLNALQMAQMGLKQRLFFESEIYITTHIGTKVINRTVKVAATVRK